MSRKVTRKRFAQALAAGVTFLALAGFVAAQSGGSSGGASGGGAGGAGAGGGASGAGGGSTGGAGTSGAGGAPTSGMGTSGNLGAGGGTGAAGGQAGQAGTGAASGAGTPGQTGAATQGGYGTGNGSGMGADGRSAVGGAGGTYGTGGAYGAGVQGGAGYQQYSQGMAGGTDAQSTDRFLAALLIIKNRGEIDMARMAEQHLTTQEAKNLAQTFQRDHTQFVDNLERLVAGTTAQSRMAARPVMGEGQGAATMPPAGAATMAPSGAATSPAGVDPLRFTAEVAQRVGAIQQRDMGQRHGRSLDRSFLDSQEPMHIEMLATLAVARDHASPQLQPLIDQGIATTQRHIQEIRDVKARLGFGGAPSRSQKPQ